jgi:hypothetical protein
MQQEQYKQRVKFIHIYLRTRESDQLKLAFGERGRIPPTPPGNGLEHFHLYGVLRTLYGILYYINASLEKVTVQREFNT